MLGTFYATLTYKIMLGTFYALLNVLIWLLYWF